MTRLDTILCRISRTTKLRYVTYQPISMHHVWFVLQTSFVKVISNISSGAATIFVNEQGKKTRSLARL